MLSAIDFTVFKLKLMYLASLLHFKTIFTFFCWFYSLMHKSTCSWILLTSVLEYFSLLFCFSLKQPHCICRIHSPQIFIQTLFYNYLWKETNANTWKVRPCSSTKRQWNTVCLGKWRCYEKIQVNCRELITDINHTAIVQQLLLSGNRLRYW